MRRLYITGMRLRAKMVAISVIIPTLNEEKYLPKLLSCLKEQTFNDFEVIVADAGSSDSTRKIALSFGAKVVSGGMPAVGRNSGARAALGQFLFFFDADVKFSRQFLERAHHEMQDRFLDLATCEFRPLSNIAIDRAAHRLSGILMRIGQDTNPHAPGFCILITKRLFDRIGGFDESLKLAEDHDLVKRASRLRPLRVLNKARITVSVRRLKKEGRLPLITKYARVELYRALRGEIKDDIIPYEFGSFEKQVSPKAWRLIEARLMRMERDYRRLRLTDLSLNRIHDELRSLFSLIAGSPKGRRKR
jgi:glycosyltransferase involved in cell wall biosynthesis